MRNRTDSLKPLKEGVAEALVRVAEAAQRGGGIVGTPSGFADLDKLTAGFEAGQLVILAARPGMGKTSFALNLAHNAGVKHRLPVAIFSLEMPRSDLALRMICACLVYTSRKITEMDCATSSSLAWITGAVAAMAEPPQIDEPTPIKMALFFFKRSALYSTKADVYKRQ